MIRGKVVCLAIVLAVALSFLSVSDSFAIKPDSGWTSVITDNWQYGGDDNPSYTVIVPGNKKTNYWPGMRVQLIQQPDNKPRYFIITSIAYLYPNTTLTLYGGTDYKLINASIWNPAVSTHKAPQGFPVNPAKWTVEVTDNIEHGQAAPAINQWYNIGAINAVIPLGLWDIEYFSTLTILDASTTTSGQITISSSNNSETYPDFTEMVGFQIMGSTYVRNKIPISRRKTVSFNAKTILYLNERTVSDNIDYIIVNETFNGNTSKTIIRAICAYL